MVSVGRCAVPSSWKRRLSVFTRLLNTGLLKESINVNEKKTIFLLIVKLQMYCLENFKTSAINPNHTAINFLLTVQNAAAYNTPVA